jgi:hypothetical protein
MLLGCVNVLTREVLSNGMKYVSAHLPACFNEANRLQTYMQLFGFANYFLENLKFQPEDSVCSAPLRLSMAHIVM